MKTLALLIDGDNAQLAHTKRIIQFCEGFGTLSIKKAYGDWKKPPLSTHSQAVKKLGVELVQQDRNGKEDTDMRMAMDTGFILAKGGVDIYFIASSDGDFTIVCDQIHQNGAKIIGIGSKNTSSKLRNACTMFFDVEEIIENQSKASAQPKSTPKPTMTAKVKPVTVIKAKAAATVKPEPALITKPKPKPMLKMLVRAYQEAPQQDGWVLLPQLRESLVKLDQHFEQRFAGKKLSAWIKTFPEQFEIADHRVRMK